MTCAWLDGEQNCWVELVERARACAPSQVGEVSRSRDACAFDDGAMFELTGQLERPEPGSFFSYVGRQRLVSADGDECFEASPVGPFDTTFSAAGDEHVVRVRVVGVVELQVVCEDGRTYSSRVEGTCEDYSDRFSRRQLPGYMFACEDDGRCNASFHGAGLMDPVIATCAW